MKISLNESSRRPVRSGRDSHTLHHHLPALITSYLGSAQNVFFIHSHGIIYCHTKSHPVPSQPFAFQGHHILVRQSR